MSETIERFLEDLKNDDNLQQGFIDASNNNILQFLISKGYTPVEVDDITELQVGQLSASDVFCCALHTTTK